MNFWQLITNNLNKPWNWQGISCNTFKYGLALNKLKSIRSLNKQCKIHNRYKLTKLITTRAFCEWYYHPQNIGGRIAKDRILNLFSKK